MAAPNVDLFDVYFRRADLDRDGRISGNEAVAFFQGSNLDKNILAQIWTYADQNRTGFLGRAEFYNALKLVTIAQSKRELTQDIVKAAFYGPASAKIPAPQINLPATSGPQPVVNGNPQVGAVPGSSQTPAFRPVTSQNTNINQQYNLSQNNQAIRPPQPAPSGIVRPLHGVASQGFSGAGSAFGTDPSNSRIQVNAGDGKTNGLPTGMISQTMDRSLNIPSAQNPGFRPVTSQAGLAPRPPASLSMMPPTSVNKAPLTQNGFASGSFFGGDGFLATQAQKKDVLGATSSAGSMPVSSGSIPVSHAALSSSNSGSLEAIQNSPTVQSGGGQGQKMQPLPKQHQQFTAQNVSGAPRISPQVNATQSQQQWPRMTQSDLQKYTKLFVEVDKDKDGKITGEQARNLFLSWKLPRDILKQVWDLSDQDNDSMLSVREFCIALYLMERHREGHALPPVLPSNIMQDLPAAPQTAGGFGNATWGYSHGPQQPPTSGFAARPPTRPSGRPPLPVPAAQADSRALPKQQKAKVPVLEKNLVDQLSEEEQKSLNSKFNEATEADKKVEELEKEIKESREKMEFYRVKLQELVLYKSRCDTRLNEVTERVSADKREAELLAKKYEEKYKQTGDVASRLTIEEATFRDIQEKKMELYRAIVKLEQDGGTDEKLKARVEQIQSNLEELVKSLNDRCKTYGLRAKPTTLVELPFGWQPGIQQGAADWDEDWDKFEDEGFTCVKELSLDVKNIVAPPKTKAKPAKGEESATKESEKRTASSNADVKAEKADGGSKELNGSQNREESSGGAVLTADENGSAHEHADPVEVRSPAGSPAAKSSHDSPRSDFSNGGFEKKFGSDASPRANETRSDHRGTESSFSGYKSFDEPGWGTFDHNDDVDSVWGANPVSTSKDMEDDDLFAPGGFSLNPIKTGSKFGDSSFLKKGSSIFADSVPSTPFSSTYSPQKFNDGPDEHLPSFSRFDSFRSIDSSLQPRETLSRFDSMRSTDYEYGKGFPSFDDSDSFGPGPFRSALGSETPRTEVDAFGTGPFRSGLGSETPRTEVDAYGTGPFRSTLGSETPRIEVDAFGTGPFRSSLGSETPRTEVDPFGAVPFRSTFGSETPRDSDPFGSGPFKSSFGVETPRSESDPFGSVGPFRSSLGSETPRSDWMGSETPRGDFDSFGYGGPFRSSFGSETPRSEADPFGSSSPFQSNLGDETPRRDSDPFGYSGSFKSSFTSETPKGTNNWSAF